MTGKIRMAIGIGLWAALAAATVPPSGAAFPATPAMGNAGKLIIIGGNLASAREAVYQQWITWAGGREKIRLAIIPAASVEPAVSGRSVADDFRQLGVAAEHIKVFPVALVDDSSTKDTDESRWGRNGFDEKLAREMSSYNAVFFVGGDQIRYQKTLIDASGRDSPLLAEIRAIYRNGGVLGGTSAGAAMMSDPMICDGSSIDAVVTGPVFQAEGCASAGGVRLTRGLGFFQSGLVDQHCLKRGRFGRLLVALLFLKNPAIGFGIDEDTALLVEGSMVTVMGSSGVVIIDTRRAQGERTAAGLKASNVILHLLADGDQYDIATDRFLIAPDRKPITRGAEEFETYPLLTDIFGRDSLTDLLTNGLVDNLQSQSRGMSFRLEADNSGRGVMMTFRKTDQTVGRYGERDGRDLYTVLTIFLDVTPIKVRVETQKPE